MTLGLFFPPPNKSHHVCCIGFFFLWSQDAKIQPPKKKTIGMNLHEIISLKNVKFVHALLSFLFFSNWKLHMLLLYIFH